MKKKTSTKTKAPVLSRLTQKTFITVAAFAFIMSGAMTIKYYVDVMQMGDAFSFALYTMYPLVTLAGPLLSFIIVYLISKEKATKLWRVCKAAIVTMIAIIFQTFASLVNLSAFSKPMGYGEAEAVSYGYLLEILPFVLAIILAVVLSRMISNAKGNSASDVSPLLQKVFLFSIILFGLGQPILSSVMQIGSPLSQPTEVLVFDALTGLIMPAVVLGVIYLLISKQRSVLERSFITLFYAVIVAMILIPLSSAPYIFSGPMDTASYNSWAAMYLPGILTIVIFAGIITWHKIKKAI